ncbi:hypothetical protein BDN67DRAFT_985485 [Paxillus ammoniavirescens]|nr:hypothetical protein BDN67DRAFT_985485 [Paxillus ammoniavirescens]
MLSSSDEIDPTELQHEEEQCCQEAENRIWEAEAKKAKDEEKKRQAVEEAHRTAEKEAEEETKKRAKDERKKLQSMEADKKKKTPGTSVVHPQETEGITYRTVGNKSVAMLCGFSLFGQHLESHEA